MSSNSEQRKGQRQLFIFRRNINSYNLKNKSSSCTATITNQCACDFWILITITIVGYNCLFFSFISIQYCNLPYISLDIGFFHSFPALIQAIYVSPNLVSLMLLSEYIEFVTSNCFLYITN
jgi:hypothetical protein